jgi:hypothetical protein
VSTAIKDVMTATVITVQRLTYWAILSDLTPRPHRAKVARFLASTWHPCIAARAAHHIFWIEGLIAGCPMATRQAFRTSQAPPSQNASLALPLAPRQPSPAPTAMGPLPREAPLAALG